MNRWFVWGMASMLLLSAVPLATCTVLVLQGGENVYVAKNLDWPVGEGFVLVNRRGEEKTALLPSAGVNPLAWRSRFGSVTVNLLGREFPLGGMNEQGLVIEEASFSPSRYPRGGGRQVNEFQWIQYHLDTCADTREVLASLEGLEILPILARVHYLVCDAAGRAAVVEFISGRVRVYTGGKLPVAVMTNNGYDNSLKYLSRHQGFGGERLATGGPGSPERFVRAAARIRGLQSRSGLATPRWAFRILAGVAQHDTQWRIVYDAGEREIHLRTLRNPVPRTLRLRDFDFQHPLASDIHAVPLRFSPFDAAANTRLLREVFARMVRFGIVAAAKAAALRDRLIAYNGGND